MGRKYSVELTSQAQEQIFQIAQYVLKKFHAPEAANQRMAASRAGGGKKYGVKCIHKRKAQKYCRALLLA